MSRYIALGARLYIRPRNLQEKRDISYGAISRIYII